MRLSHLAAAAFCSAALLACVGDDGGTATTSGAALGAPDQHGVLGSGPTAPEQPGTQLGSGPTLPSGGGDDGGTDIADPPTAPETPPIVVDPNEHLFCDEADAFAGEIKAAALAGSTACQVDADCTVSHAMTSCSVQGEVTAVSFAGLAHFDAQIAAVRTVCGNALGTSSTDGPDEAIGCPVAIMDWFTPPAAVCDAGTCVLEAGDNTCWAAPEDADPVADTVEGCLDCDLAAQKADAAMRVAVETVNACSTDADCTIGSDFTGCVGTCGVGINKAYAADWSQALDDIAGDYCTGGCPVAMAGCLPQRAVCAENRCTVVVEEPPVAID